MRLFISILLFVHGMIHFMGFAKAFSFGNLSVLAKEISKGIGILWLITALVFIYSCILYITKKDSWWIMALIGVFISQYVIFTSWSDAKFGTIVNIIILFIVFIAWKSIDFSTKFYNDVKNAKRESDSATKELLTENDIMHLPGPIQKYIRITESLNKDKVYNFAIEFEGRLRKSNNDKWMPIKSIQYNFIKHPSRLFFINATMNHLPVAGYHKYQNATAIMDIKLLSIFRVQYMHGAKMDISETVTFFNDMCTLAPATLIDPRIKWQEINAHQVHADFTNADITISADLFFDDSGKLINFISHDRFSFDAGKNLPWSTPLSNYKSINGYNLARFAQAIYHDGIVEEIYGEFKTMAVKYNVE